MVGPQGCPACPSVCSRPTEEVCFLCSLWPAWESPSARHGDTECYDATSSVQGPEMEQGIRYTNRTFKKVID